MAPLFTGSKIGFGRVDLPSITSSGQYSGASAPILNTSDSLGQVVSSGVRNDSNASYLVLAVPMNGTNGGSTFTDQVPTGRTSSTKTFTNTSVTTSTTQSKFYGSSGSFNGSAYLQLASSSDFYFNTAFTVECWCYRVSTAGDNPIFFVGNWNSNQGIFLGYNSTGLPFISVNAGGTGSITGNTSLSLNSWNHIAFVSTGSGGTNSIYLNGSSVGSTSQGNPTNNTSNVVIGAYVDTNYQSAPRAPMTGYLQDLRVYKGVAKYTSTFTP